MQENFLKNHFIPTVYLINPQTKPKWGLMNSQQMVEHVAEFFKISTAKRIFPVLTAEADLPRFKAFLLSDKPFKENTKAPATILPDTPLPTKYADLPEALATLSKEVNYFFTYYQNNVGIIQSHPVFGPLNYNEWVLLHYKHVIHHLKQFELVSQ